MNQRVVLLTGAFGGIGKAIAEKLASSGYSLALNGIESEGKKLANEWQEGYGVTCRYYAHNLLDRKACSDLVQQVLNDFGRLDILINNAGIQYVSPIDQFPDEQWDRILGLNLTAAFQLSKGVWPFMANQQFGRIVNIASAHGLVASPFKSAYVASKHGIIGFTKALALEGATLGITCNAVCPGFVHTPIVDNQIQDMMAAHHLSREEVIQQRMLGKQAIKEFIPASLIADMVHLLCRDESKLITGSVYTVDGGWTAE